MVGPLPMPNGHEIAVTDDGIRVHVECSCGYYSRHAAMRGGNIAGLRHYIEHQDDAVAAANAAAQLSARINRKGITP